MSFTNLIRLLSIVSFGLSVYNLVPAAAANNGLKVLIHLGLIMLSLSALPLLDYADNLES